MAKRRRSLGDMSRKDYELLAQTLREAGACGKPIAKTLARHLAAQNPRFRSDLFLKAAAAFDGYVCRRRGR